MESERSFNRSPERKLKRKLNFARLLILQVCCYYSSLRRYWDSDFGLTILLKCIAPSVDLEHDMLNISSWLSDWTSRNELQSEDTLIHVDRSCLTMLIWNMALQMWTFDKTCQKASAQWTVPEKWASMCIAEMRTCTEVKFFPLFAPSSRVFE